MIALVVDEDRERRERVTRALSGHFELEATTPSQALGVAREARPGLVIVGATRARDAIEIVHALRGDDATRDVKIAVLCPDASEEGAAGALEAGADDYLVEPAAACLVRARAASLVELAQLRRHLQDERGRWALALAELPAIVCVTRGKDHVVEFANGPQLALFGRIDVVGRTLASLLTPAEVERYLPVLDEVLATRTPYARRSVEAISAPSPRYRDWVVLPVADAGDEEGATSLVSFAYDVTELVTARRQAETAHAELREQVRVSETLHRIGLALNQELEHERLVQVLSDEATALCRAEFGAFFYTTTSPQGEERLRFALSGAPREQFDGFPMPRPTQLLGPTFRGEPPVRVDDVTTDPRLGQNPPYKGMPRGHVPVRSYLALPVIARTGEVLGALFFGHSVPATFTQRDEDLIVSVAAQAAAALDNARLYAQARAANDAKDEFLAMLGHELRNPLSPITTALRVLRLRGGAASRELEVIERQVEHLTRLVDDLLDVSRIASGKVQLKRSRLRIGRVIARAVEIASPLLEAQRHMLEVDVASPDLVVDGDAVRLAQVIANLLTNAAKYTNPGGAVVVTARQQGADVVVRVRDTGVGISPELLPRVFEMFVQGVRARDRSQGGLGLGLSLVKSLVELHGGAVSARSGGSGCGSEFEVRLPAATDDGDADPGRATPVTDAPTSTSGRQRILVVDDNEDAAELLAELLRELGHEVLVALDGPAGLALALDAPPDLAILDIGLPVMDGYELAARLREQGEGRALRLVALTGYGQETDRARSAAAGFDHHLVKPLDPDVLLDLLR